MKATRAAWVQAVALAVLALCALILAADLLLVQWQISQALDGVQQQLEQLSRTFGGGGEPAPCDPAVQPC